MSSAVPLLIFGLPSCTSIKPDLHLGKQFYWRAKERGERDQPRLNVGLTLIQALGRYPGQLICGQAPIHQFSAALMSMTQLLNSRQTTDTHSLRSHTLLASVWTSHPAAAPRA